MNLIQIENSDLLRLMKSLHQLVPCLKVCAKVIAFAV